MKVVNAQMKMKKSLLLMSMSPMLVLAQNASTFDASSFKSKSTAPQPKKEQRIEKMQVTGSLIKKVDVEGPKPIQTLDREALDRAGYNSVGDVLRDLSANSFGGAREQSGSTTAGVASVNLRGLGADRTLVLVNGRRVAKDGIAGVVDLNLFPMAAIERIDILKDSSSATYGSDAIGGVINLITKSDYDGAEMEVRHEAAEYQGGNRTTVSGTWGKSNSRGNIMTAFQYRENTKVFSRDRDWTSTGESTFAPIPNINTGDGFASAGQCLSGNVDGNGRCLYNFADFATETPEIKQFNIFSNGKYDIDATTQAYIQGNYTQKQTNWQYAPGAVRLNGLKSDYIADNVEGYDPNRGVDFRWRSTALGNRVNETTETSFGATVGFKKFIGDTWEIDTQVSGEKIKRDDRSVGGYANAANLRDALESGANCDWINGGTCNLPSNVAYNPYEIMESELTRAEVIASGEVVDLPNGAVAMAVGAQVFNEKFSDVLDPLSQEGGVAGGGAGSTGAGDRQVTAVFAEFNIPVLENMEVQASGRYDRYSDFGDTLNPALSMRYKPFESLLVRASASTGFKAANMIDLYRTSSQGFPTVIDTKYCNENPNSVECDPAQYETTFAGNQDLKEETSKSLSMGFVYEPSKHFNTSVDFFHVQMDNVVGNNLQGVLDAEANGADTSKYGTTINRDPSTGRITSIETGQMNLGERKVAGYDWGFQLKGYVAGIGRLGFSQSTTWLIRYDENTFPGQSLSNTLQINGAPEWRNNIALDYGPTEDLSLLVNLNTTGSNFKLDSTEGKLERYTQVDAQITYAFRELQGRLTIGARNILGDTPPLDDSNINDQLNADLYNPIGRRFFAAYSQSF